MTPHANTLPTDVLTLQARVQELERQLASATAAQRAANTRLDLLEEIVQRMPLGLHVYRLEDADDDRSLVLVAANQAAAAMTGVGNDAIIGHTIDVNFPELRASGIPQAYAAVARGGSPLTVERLTYSDARVLEGAFSVKAVPLANRCVAVVFENVTMRKQAEERLTLFETLAETALDGVAFANLDGVIEYGNPAFRAMTGFGPALVGTLIPGFFGPEEQPYIEEVLFPTLREQGQWAGTLPARRPDGSSWIAHISIVTLRNAQGVLTQLAGVCRDVTLAQAQERRLRQVEVMVENAPDGFSYTELDGRIIYLNPAFRTMLGYGDTPAGAPLLQFFAEHEHERIATLIQLVLVQNSWQGTISYRRADGSLFDAQLTAFVVRDGAGAPIGLAGIARDLTAEQRHEQERLALQEQVIQAQQAALRELSTPLIPIAEGVVAMPLIGSIDSSRAQLVLETLLEGVAASRASTAILDITGVPVVDTQVANALLRAAQAVKLLGAQVVLTGIRPEVAQTLVGLGADLGGIVTRATLQSGIAFGMKQG